nr:immunoglobulin heavy chain junction region [Mus musculus]MBK4197188.1 immunoglobulin heavy chain junction region [Mus musculus]
CARLDYAGFAYW